MTEIKGTQHDCLPLIINEDDFDPETRATLGKISSGKKVLDPGSKEEVISKALPSAIIRKLQTMVPKGYKLGSIDLELELKGYQRIWRLEERSRLRSFPHHDLSAAICTCDGW